MSVRNLLFVCLAALLVARPLEAQSEARIKVVQPSVDRLKEDLKYLVELSPTSALKKQWKTLEEDLIDAFKDGVDLSKPMRVDLVLGKSLIYEMHFPVEKLEGAGGFLKNIDGLGWKSKKLAAGSYELVESGKGSNKTKYFLRHANGYGSIAPKAEAVPANLPDPILPVKHLLEKDYDVGGELKNDPTDAKGMTARKANFQELRKELEAAVKFKRGEDKNVFELRKLSLEQNLDQAERFIVETEQLTVRWITDVKGAKGHGELSFSALPDTDLAKSTAAQAAKPSYFANVKLSDKPAVLGRINLAIDAMNIEHAKASYKAVRPVAESKIDERPTLKTAEQKTAAKKAINVLIDMFDEGLKLEVVDGFVDMYSAGNRKHTLICGIRVSDGKQVDEMLKHVEQIGDGWKVKFDVAKQGDVTIHTVSGPPERTEKFQKLFPGETEIYVGTSKDAVWGAAGIDALDKLKAAIEQAAGAAPEKADPTILVFSAEGARLVEMWDFMKPTPAKIDKPTKEQQQREKELEKIRQLATDATKGCEAVFSGDLKRKDNVIEGTLDVSECALKFVGTMIADFVKNMQ